MTYLYSNVKIFGYWAVFLLLRHPTPKGKRNTQVCKCSWSKRNDISQEVCKSLQSFISKLYHCHGNWYVIPLLSSISTQWWVLNKEVEWEKLERGREKDHLVLAPVSTQLMGCPESWSMYTWAAWGYLFIGKFSLLWR